MGGILMYLQPDGFIGAVMAVEGITDATALLHGQNGCRKGLLLSQRMCPRTDRIIDLDAPVYRGCPTVPYSNVNQGDYTGKSGGKLSQALDYIAHEDYRLIMLTCSPGISIVGDDCMRAARECGLEDRVLVMDSGELGCHALEGFDVSVAKILEKVCRRGRSVKEGTVSIVGLSIMHKDWTSVRKECDHMLEHMGLRCVCYAGAGCTVKELEDSIDSEFVIDMSPDYSVQTRSFYQGKGIPVITTGSAPVGFDAVEALIREVGKATGCAIDKPIAMVGRHRRRAYGCITAAGKSLHGRTFSVSAPPCVKEPLVSFLTESFAMVYSDDDYEILFADGNRCVMERSSGRCGRCIDIGFPSNKVDFNHNPVLGLNGTLYLLDRLFE